MGFSKQKVDISVGGLVNIDNVKLNTQFRQVWISVAHCLLLALGIYYMYDFIWHIYQNKWDIQSEENSTLT